MTELDCKIDGCDYSGSPQGLRSHLHGRKDDEHVDAATDRSHHDWYPAAYGLDEESTDDEGDGEGDETPTEIPSKGADPDPSEKGTDREGADTLDSDPSDGGAESPDEEDEYAAQWEGADTPSDGASDDGESDPSERGSAGEDDDTPSDEGGMDLGTALVLGTGALAVAVLVSKRGSNPSEGGTESPDVTNPNDTLGQSGRGGTGWGQDGGSDPLEGTDTDDMDFTPTET